jgi:uncharacterized spore protein YtfJ
MSATLSTWAKPVSEPIEHLLERLMATTVFGTPTTAGAVTLIPVSAIRVGFGYGAGGGQAPGETASAPSGGGGGGGGNGSIEPRGYIKITPSEVKFEPIMDQGRLALAGILMVAWNVFWISATIRAALKHRNGQQSA